MSDDTKLGCAGVGFGLVIVVAVASLFFVQPMYNVWAQKKAGEAKLAESQASRQVLVSEAQAKAEAAKLLGEAELTRANYASQAAAKLSAELSPLYIQYLWVATQEKMSDSPGESTIIYIPTDKMGIPVTLPVTEAGRVATPSLPNKR